MERVRKDRGTGTPRRGSAAELVGCADDGWYSTHGVVLWRIAGFEGSSLWGRIGVAEVDAAFATVRHHATESEARRYQVVTDLAGVTAIDPEVYQRLGFYLRTLVPAVSARIDRHLIILPASVVGAAAAGWMHLHAPHAWQIAPDLGAAVGTAIAARIATIVEATRDPDLVAALRAQLAIDATTPLPAAARSLGVSPRTLQRALLHGGTGFRALADEARLIAACRLLDESDLKVEAVAQEVGFRSLSGFVRAFRRHRRDTPHRYRARRSTTRAA